LNLNKSIISSNSRIWIHLAFLNCLPETFWRFGNFLAWPFLNVDDNTIIILYYFLRPVLEKSEQNLQYFMKMSKCYSKNVLQKIGLYSAFFIFENLDFLKQHMAKFGLWNFLDLATLPQKLRNLYIFRKLWRHQSPFVYDPKICWCRVKTRDVTCDEIGKEFRPDQTNHRCLDNRCEHEH